MNKRFAIIASLVGATVLTPMAASASQAQSYNSRSSQPMTYEQCIEQQQGRQVAGALIGGLLGAVVGAEIHDDQQDRDRERYDRRRDRHRDYDRHRRHDRYDRYDRRDRYDRHDRHHRRRHHDDRRWKEDGNDGAVLAGGAVGALAGAAIAGSGDCEQYRYNSNSSYNNGGYNSGYDSQYDNSGYNSGYSSGSGYDAYESQSQSSSGYERYNSDELAGAPGSSNRQTRTYSTSSSQPANTGNCRMMSAGAGRQTYMCQGTDGVWRPSGN